MAEHKIPHFASSEFRSVSVKDRGEFVAQLNNWKASQMAEALVQHLRAEVEKSYKVEEQAEPESRFQAEYITARERGKRSALRDLIKQLES